MKPTILSFLGLFIVPFFAYSQNNNKYTPIDSPSKVISQNGGPNQGDIYGYGEPSLGGGEPRARHGEPARAAGAASAGAATSRPTPPPPPPAHQTPPPPPPAPPHKHKHHPHNQKISSPVRFSIEGNVNANYFKGKETPLGLYSAGLSFTPRFLLDYDFKCHIMLGSGLGVNTINSTYQLPFKYRTLNGAIGSESGVIGSEQTNEQAGSDAISDGIYEYFSTLRYYRMTYLEVPVNLSFYSNYFKESNWRIIFSLGVVFGVRINSLYRDTYGYLYDKEPLVDLNTENIKPFFSKSEEESNYVGKLKLENNLGAKANFWNIDANLRIMANYYVAPNFSVNFGMGYRYGILNSLGSEHEKYQKRNMEIHNHQWAVLIVGFSF